MKKDKKPDRFTFELDSINNGKLCYKNLTLMLGTDNDELSERECALIDVIVDTLNKHYPD